MSEELRKVTHVENIRYDKEREELIIIDQTLLPNEERFITLTTAEEMYGAIKTLKVRGAPAIGICAAYSLYSLARTIPEGDGGAFYEKLASYSAYLNSSRPTAVNLSWALKEMLATAKAHLDLPRAELLEVLPLQLVSEDYTNTLKLLFLSVPAIFLMQTVACRII